MEDDAMDEYRKVAKKEGAVVGIGDYGANVLFSSLLTKRFIEHGHEEYTINDKIRQGIRDGISEEIVIDGDGKSIKKAQDITDRLVLNGTGINVDKFRGKNLKAIEVSAFPYIDRCTVLKPTRTGITAPGLETVDAFIKDNRPGIDSSIDQVGSRLREQNCKVIVVGKGRKYAVVGYYILYSALPKNGLQPQLLILPTLTNMKNAIDRAWLPYIQEIAGDQRVIPIIHKEYSEDPGRSTIDRVQDEAMLETISSMLATREPVNWLERKPKGKIFAEVFKEDVTYLVYIKDRVEKRKKGFLRRKTRYDIQTDFKPDVKGGLESFRTSLRTLNEQKEHTDGCSSNCTKIFMARCQFPELAENLRDIDLNGWDFLTMGTQPEMTDEVRKIRLDPEINELAKDRFHYTGAERGQAIDSVQILLLHDHPPNYIRDPLGLDRTANEIPQSTCSELKELHRGLSRGMNIIAKMLDTTPDKILSLAR